MNVDFFRITKKAKKKKKNWVTLCSVIPTFLVGRYFDLKNLK